MRKAAVSVCATASRANGPAAARFTAGWLCGTLLLRSADAHAAPAVLSVPTVDPSESILCATVNEAAPDPHPPPNILLRYNERYDYLANPRNREDFLDPLKYISLDSGDEQSYLSFGGELRERYQNFNNAAIGPVTGELDQSYLLQKITLHADLHVDPRLRLFAEGISGLRFGDLKDAPASQQDPLDVQQGFVEYTAGELDGQGPRLTWRFGRLEMYYGSGRLIATREPPNIPYNFDGVQLGASWRNVRIHVFAVHPVVQHEYHLDTDSGSNVLWGLYTSLPGAWSVPAKLDIYYLGARNAQASYATGRGAELRHTFGTRWHGKAGAWDYDWEPVYQTGDFTGRRILAWTLAADTGYTISGLDWRPRVALKADIASGDRGGKSFGSFNPLYYKSGYFDDASLIRPINIDDLHPSLQLPISTAYTLTLAADFLWRYSVKDAVYNSTSGVELKPRPGPAYIGKTLESAFTWKAGRHFTGTLSYVHLYAGESTRLNGGHDVDYLGSWVTFTW